MARKPFPQGEHHQPPSFPIVLSTGEIRKQVAETRDTARDRRAHAHRASARTRQILQSSQEILQHNQAWRERQVELGNLPPVLASQSSFPLLLIEDSPADVALFRYVLKEGAFPCQLTVLTQESEVEAFVTQATTGALLSLPRLIIADCRIPGMEIEAILAAVRTAPACQHVPVILFSSLPEEEGQRRCVQCGATAFIHKPSELGAFVEAVSTMVQCWSGKGGGADPLSTQERR